MGAAGPAGIRQRLRSKLSPMHPAPPVQLQPCACHGDLLQVWAAFSEHPSASPTHPMACPPAREGRAVQEHLQGGRWHRMKQLFLL